MMYYRVKRHKVNALDILINIIDSLYCNEEVETIRDNLLERLNNPKNYTCLSQDDIDDIFKPKKEDWADITDIEGPYGAIKPVLKVIKNLMFEDDPCPEIKGSDHF